jgi:hypothetical protein
MTEQKKSTEERLRETVSKETTAFLAASFVGNPFYSHDLTASEAFLCREFDDIRGQLASALGQLGMLGLPEPPKEGEHVHSKVYSSGVLTSHPPQYPWVCSVCLETGADSGPLRAGPTYEELLAKKRGLAK